MKGASEVATLTDKAKFIRLVVDGQLEAAADAFRRPSVSRLLQTGCRSTFSKGGGGVMSIDTDIDDLDHGFHQFEQSFERSATICAVSDSGRSKRSRPPVKLRDVAESPCMACLRRLVLRRGQTLQALFSLRPGTSTLCRAVLIIGT